MFSYVLKINRVVYTYMCSTKFYLFRHISTYYLNIGITAEGHSYRLLKCIQEGWYVFKRVLIVDDAVFMRKSLSLILKNSGFEIVGEAENGINGIKKYLELKPDLVTMDITMPEMDGLTALKEIRKIDNNAKVIMVSAMGQEAYVREAIMAGAKSFIVKPFKESHVIRVLESIMSLNR